MRFPDDLLYHAEHTWVRIEGNQATVGITDHAQKELGDVVYVELPKVGRKIGFGQVFGSVESSKSVSELFCPVAGEVTEVNGELEDSPEKINDDPYGDGWMVRIKMEPGYDTSKLMDAGAYAKKVS